MEPVTEKKNRKPPTPSDKVRMNKAELEKIDRWVTQATENTNGFMTVTRADVMNFIIREHKESLTSRELSHLRAHHYDPIKHMNWISSELKTALAKNDKDAVAKLQNEIKGIHLSYMREQKPSEESGSGENKQRRRRTKKSEDALESLSQETLPSGPI